MPKLVLHIGTEKTGTTSIQSFLDLNREVLKERGFHVLESTKTKNHRAVASYCMSERIFKDDFFRDRGMKSIDAVNNFKTKFKEEFDEELRSIDSNIHTVVITSEHFHSRLKTYEEIGTLKELLAPYFSEIRILCYLREQSALAESLYSSMIKSGGIERIDDFFDNCSIGNEYFNYSTLLKRWADVFGRETLCPRLFSTDAFVQGELLEDFLWFLDKRLNLIEFKQVERENKSIDIFGKVIGRAFNLISPRFTEEGRKNLENRAFSNKVFETYVGNGSVINREQYDRIYQEFSSSNIELGEAYFCKRENPFVYNPPNESLLIKDEYSEVLADMIRHCSFSEKDAEALRNVAIELKEQNLELSYSPMKMTYKLKPHDCFINQKFKLYLKRLKNRLRKIFTLL